MLPGGRQDVDDIVFIFAVKIYADVCSPNPCQNGGTCTSTPGGFKCACHWWYTGEDCGTKRNGLNFVYRKKKKNSNYDKQQHNNDNNDETNNYEEITITTPTERGKWKQRNIKLTWEVWNSMRNSIASTWTSTCSSPYKLFCHVFIF